MTAEKQSHINKRQFSMPRKLQLFICPISMPPSSPPSFHCFFQVKLSITRNETSTMILSDLPARKESGQKSRAFTFQVQRFMQKNFICRKAVEKERGGGGENKQQRKSETFCINLGNATMCFIIIYCGKQSDN